MGSPESFDLTVIGGGPGGYGAAVRALQLGLKVAVVEQKEMGGTCLTRGCIPTKALLHAAGVYHAVKTCGEFGVAAKKAGFDYGRIALKKDAAVKRLRLGVEQLVEGNGGVILRGKGVIRDRHTVEIAGESRQTIRTDKIIVATGSRPAKLPIPGAEEGGVLDSDGVLSLRSCPSWMRPPCRPASTQAPKSPGRA